MGVGASSRNIRHDPAKQGRKRGLKGGLFVTAAAVAILCPVAAIHAEESLRATLTLSQRLQSVSNSPSSGKDGLQSLTSLDFGLRSQTRTQTFALGLSTGINYPFGDSSGATLDNPVARLSYGLESKSSTLDFSASYRKSDVATSNFYDEALGQDVVVGGGQRALTSVRTGLTLGRDGPVTFDLRHSYSRSIYTDTTDPTLLDSTRQRLSADLSLRVSPVLTTTLSASRGATNQVGPTGTDTTTESLGFSARYAVDPALTASAGISYDRNTSAGPGGDLDTHGLGFNLGLDRDLANGTLGATLSSSETINGTRSQILFTRSLDLPRGSLSLGFGATKTDGLPLRALVDLGLTLDVTDTSQFSVGLSQTATTSDTDAETIATRLSARYTAELTALSSLSGGVQVADQNALAPGASDRISFSADLRFDRELGQDWSLVSGYSRTVSRVQGAAARTKDTVFVGLEKSLDVRP